MKRRVKVGACGDDGVEGVGPNDEDESNPVLRKRDLPR